ncbi:MAG: glycosyltransferase [Hyphomicrobiales bacterium]|nr:glycosyltransferase [Hyphomicrobiales bacterium]
MSATPLVSVVVAAYKHEAFIEACLRSIERQTYARLELILIDDCSPDATFDIASRVAAKSAKRYARVVVKRNAVNRGAHFTLNRAASLAQGEYISFMNSDDAYAPTRIEAMTSALARSGRRWGFSGVLTIDADGQPYFDETLCHHIYWRPHVYSRRLPSLSWCFMPFQATASTGNLFVERALHERIGGFADLKYCHDWDYALRAVFEAEPAFEPQDLYLYRIHGANSFRSLSDVAEADTRYCLRGYLSRAMSRRPVNPLAPSPANWPTLFHPLIQTLGLQSHVKALYDPYQPHHRTVDLAAAE